MAKRPDAKTAGAANGHPGRATTNAFAVLFRHRGPGQVQAGGHAGGHAHDLDPVGVLQQLVEHLGAQAGQALDQVPRLLLAEAAVRSDQASRRRTAGWTGNPP
jgi:hypothetical protein